MIDDYNHCEVDAACHVRLPQKLLSRIDDVVSKLQYDPELNFRGRLTRSKLIRELVIRGLPEMEGRHQ